MEIHERGGVKTRDGRGTIKLSFIAADTRRYFTYDARCAEHNNNNTNTADTCSRPGNNCVTRAYAAAAAATLCARNNTIDNLFSAPQSVARVLRNKLTTRREVQDDDDDDDMWTGGLIRFGKSNSAGTSRGARVFMGVTAETNIACGATRSLFCALMCVRVRARATKRRQTIASSPRNGRAT